MKYAIVTVILALGLAGCNLNGLSYDLSGLPSLNIDEVNCNNCNVNVNNVGDDHQNVEKHYFVNEDRWYPVQNPDSIQPITWSRLTGTTEHNWYYGSKEATDKAYGNAPRRVNVDGDSGLFIEYNYNPNIKHPNGIEYHGTHKEQYFVTGGDIELKYTPMPSGIYQYNGKLVTKSQFTNILSNGTVNAEVNFTDNKVVSIEFEGTGTGTDRRFENIGIESETGTFVGVINSNNETTTLSKDADWSDIKSRATDFEASVFGVFIGTEAKGLTGHIWQLNFPHTKGVFAAEKSNTPVVAEN